MARVHATTHHTTQELGGFWAAATPAGAAADPAALDALRVARIETGRAMTAAAARRHAKTWTFDTPHDFDAEDAWFGASIAPREVGPADRVTLRFAGLGGLAELWIGGARALASTNGHAPAAIDVTEHARRGAELVIRCASLGEAMRAKRPRPRWKTRIVARQELRFFRQPLLGRMPSWTPPCPIVGPYGPVELEHARDVAVDEASARAFVDEDGCGVVHVALRLSTFGAPVLDAIAHVGEVSARLEVEPTGRVAGIVLVDAPRLWWPHTHGEPARYAVRVEVFTGGAAVVVDLGHVGFRTIAVDRGDDGFALVVNEARVFCRGACFTPLDVVAGSSAPADVVAAVAQAADANMNMLRLSGTMLYGDDALFEACDARGVLVWQDYAFANLDYPEDAAFEAEVRAEARALLSRIEASPSLAVLCGGSEVTQQAAMMGVPRSGWASPLFDAWLPEESARARPDVVYVPNSPTGGALPFQVNAGVSHYYGVGAYLRPPDDARRAAVRFTTECLAFANVPSTRAIERLLGDGESPAHHPRWKARVPRDRGAGWDFEDVRDHYVASLFGVDPMRLRYSDMNRYLELGRVAVAELAYGAFAEWRRARSTCGGALVWFLRDLWPGAGFGLVDAHGTPKAAFYGVARALAPTAVFCTDEGQSGLFAHVVHDGAAPLAATLEIALFRGGAVEIARARAHVAVPARGAAEIPADAVLDRFYDTAYAYRFGPPPFDVAALRLLDDEGAVIGEAFHLPLGLARPLVDDVGLVASARPDGRGSYALTVTARAFAQSVAIDAGPFVPSDDRFHVAPGGARTVTLRPTTPDARLAGSVSALNASTPTRIAVAAPAAPGEP